MPVTAALSQKFYQKFGQDVTNELVNWFNAVDATYKADLKELNELNFARFDAKLEQRLAQLDAAIRTHVAKTVGDLKTDLLKWMLAFWATTLVGLGALFFRT
jgi:hypothetical protein